MNSLQSALTVIILCCTALPTYAVAPPMPGMTGGSGDNGMKHALVSQAGSTLSVHIDTPPATPVVMMSGASQDYTPSKFDVLEDVHFNAQYGWLPDGFVSLPAERSIWIERTSATQPAGSAFKVFEAGNGMEGMAAWSMNEIYSHDGFRWQWDGVMQHDYYTASRPGDYEMAFTIYVGDASGIPDPNYVAASAALQFRAIPEPATFGVALWGLMWASALKRSPRWR